MYHADQHWGEALALVLLRIHVAFEADLQASMAQLIYCESLRNSCELLTPIADPVEPAHLITQVRQHMARLTPVPVACHASPTTFVHSDLHKCLHVFVRSQRARF
jgi:hypothetical protein